MKLLSKHIQSGYLADPFGARGTQFSKGGMPSRSFQLAWEDLPKETVSLAFILIDHDAVPVCGFPWIHWTVANIDPAWGELPENASLERPLLQGVNSWASPLLPDSMRLSREEATAYGGCAPPDQTHLYLLHGFAVDARLDLSPGFYENELLNAMEGHILGHARLTMHYRSGQDCVS